MFTSMSSTWHPDQKTSLLTSRCEMRDANALIASDASICTVSTLTSDEGEAGDRLHLSWHASSKTRRSRYVIDILDINLLTSEVSQVTSPRCICFTDVLTWNNKALKLSELSLLKCFACLCMWIIWLFKWAHVNIQLVYFSFIIWMWKR